MSGDIGPAFCRRHLRPPFLRLHHPCSTPQSAPTQHTDNCTSQQPLPLLRVPSLPARGNITPQSPYTLSLEPPGRPEKPVQTSATARGHLRWGWAAYQLRHTYHTHFKPVIVVDWVHGESPPHTSGLLLCLAKERRHRRIFSKILCAREPSPCSELQEGKRDKTLSVTD